MYLPELIPGILPPSRENWEWIVYAWQFFPVISTVQYFTDFYPQGKTSIESAWNLPGKWAWLFMELPGMLIVTYCMFSIPAQEGLLGLGPAGAGLPWTNWTMAALYVTHYTYRAVLAPLFLNPSMAPIHPLVFFCAMAWQIANGLSLGGWLAGYGPRTTLDWAGSLPQIQVGMVLWGWSFMANIFHDDDLREIRRAAARHAKDRAAKEGSTAPLESVDRIYMIPKNGLFHYILYPHYLTEWCEWAAFWIIGGAACIPARTFLLNEISTMLPRALAGRRWYIAKFGKEQVGNRKAVIPGLL